MCEISHNLAQSRVRISAHSGAFALPQSPAPAIPPAAAADRAPLRRRRASWLVLGTLALGALVVLDAVAAHVAKNWAMSQLRATAEAAVALRGAMLRSEIEKQRALPLVLAGDPGVQEALAAPQEGRLLALDERLERIAQESRAGAIYVIDAQGLTRAASNYRTAESFVGSNYAFRPYFTGAMTDGQAEHFAFGTVSHRPGLYLSRRIEGTTGPLGVVVVKAEFGATEDAWHALPEPAFVTDERGIVLVASEPAWRFHATVPLDAAQRADIRASLQFGDAPLAMLPIRPSRDLPGAAFVAAPPALAGQTFVASDAPLRTSGWTLHVLAPTAPSVPLATTAARSLALLLGVAGFGVAGIWTARRRSLARERDRAAAARRELEARVAERTQALSHTNERLTAEMEERRRTQAALGHLQDELVQANKLAVLGQIAASVAHEVNQPVAAIRTYAENARLFLERGDAASARSNLVIIDDLTQRVGAITGELRAFARKAPADMEPVSLRAVLEGARLLVRHRLAEQKVALEIHIPITDVVVRAARIRLEQVFVNLLQNAIEALDGRRDGRIRITARTEGTMAVVTVSDNGPGLAASVREALFMPFVTTKPEGLGLGLVIARDIVAECGGTFTAGEGPGAVFLLTLARA
ncbi:sensor histidine kinase [Aquabacter sp. P-9]|uniref:sensor histidine kinase n=1 Tax=Aquabacter sediminis TaxID=3029197 RepID=UPI00237DDB72|nr:ATP-binding protein [Aquabacter sp. P-9]MDE1567937.1 ATP-binding protein [Aquabacter sp. P-9]